MGDKPKYLYLLAMLWPLLSIIFFAWGAFSLFYVLEIPDWKYTEAENILVQMMFFGTLLTTIVWFVFAFLFLSFSYGTLTVKKWVWTTGIIFSTIFLAIFGLMLASLMVTALMFLHYFSLLALITVIIAFLIDLGIIYCITRPSVKKYFAERFLTN